MKKVFDTSTKHNGITLNDVIYHDQGPKLQSDFCPASFLEVLRSFDL